MRFLYVFQNKTLLEMNLLFYSTLKYIWIAKCHTTFKKSLQHSFHIFIFYHIYSKKDENQLKY